MALSRLAHQSSSVCGTTSTCTHACCQPPTPQREHLRALPCGTFPRRSLTQATPDAHELRYELAQVLLAAGEEDLAVGALLHIIKREKRSGSPWNEGAAKKLLLQLFESVGNDHPLAQKGRKRLANILLM